ncbi:helix-turn-helix transcriptional regulator [Streptomyces montanisoli]|uniref:Helix-turn-helix transcriptional regulator n=1 Tax=Streptomyces montanisoli TaxID=2798581 RepID=A0A940MGH2_9ACTN|nr:LuxR family transcriptional regulator [Streptomyces montanisoli]MBP0460438.1 helix-turn-helix transcriptional regulator [Streptomyces montanisoli]
MADDPLLVRFGLDDHAARLYRTLLLHGGRTLPELSDLSGLSVDRVAVALDQLVAGSLARFDTSAGSGGRLWPVSPKVALTAALARRRVQTLRAQAEVEQLEVELAELIATHEALAGRRAVGTLQHVSDATAAAVTVFELAAASAREVLVLGPGPHTGSLGASVYLQGEQLLDRGVRLRCVHLGSLRNRPAEYAPAAHLASLGAALRTTPTLPAELMLVDGDVAVLPHDRADPSAGVVVCKHTATVTALRALFEQYWSLGEELGSSPRNDERGLTPSERELLRQLADGATDETAARRMGVSLRTVRRMAAGLIERLGARSRFQAGYRAAAMGWLDEEAPATSAAAT